MNNEASFIKTNRTVTLSRAPATMARPAPKHGGYTDELLREPGYDEAMIERIRGKE